MHQSLAEVKRLMISIHAPVKGATSLAEKNQECLGISIHAPVKGATGTRPGRSAWFRYFNPRSREGSDVPQTLNIWAGTNISIHAPVKGATARSCTVLGKNYVSRKENSSRILNFYLVFIYFSRESPAFL